MPSPVPRSRSRPRPTSPRATQVSARPASHPPASITRGRPTSRQRPPPETTQALPKVSSVTLSCSRPPSADHSGLPLNARHSPNSSPLQIPSSRSRFQAPALGPSAHLVPSESAKVPSWRSGPVRAPCGSSPLPSRPVWRTVENSRDRLFMGSITDGIRMPAPRGRHTPLSCLRPSHRFDEGPIGSRHGPASVRDVLTGS